MHAPVIGGHFHPIAAQPHAAPVAGVILRGVVKIEDARRILTFLHQRQIRPAEQVRGGFGEDPQHSCRAIGSGPIPVPGAPSCGFF